jgi:hypothetical protein
MKSDKPEWNAMKLGEMDGMGELDGMGEMNEAELNQIGEALRDFRLSVHAWSAHAHSAQVQTAHAQNVRAQQVLGWNEAAVGQPRRTLTRSLRPRVRRLALGWAMGCVLVSAGLSAGLWEHYRQPVGRAVARVAEPHWLAPARTGQRILEPVPEPGKLAQDELAQDKLAEDKPAQEERKDLMASVDSDVSRQVPSAMEPLAELMVSDERR